MNGSDIELPLAPEGECLVGTPDLYPRVPRCRRNSNEKANVRDDISGAVLLGVRLGAAWQKRGLPGQGSANLAPDSLAKLSQADATDRMTCAPAVSNPL